MTEIDEILSVSIIKPAQTEWTSPVVLEPKKDGRLRFSVVSKKLNSLTTRDLQTLLRMDESIDSLKVELFSALDAINGYWQIKVDGFDRERPALPLSTDVVDSHPGHSV